MAEVEIHRKVLERNVLDSLPEVSQMLTVKSTHYNNLKAHGSVLHRISLIKLWLLLLFFTFFNDEPISPFMDQKKNDF